MLKQILNFPNYFIDNSGNLFKIKEGGKLKELHPSVDKKTGYKIIRLKNNLTKVTRTTRVHRLVLETFIGPCPIGMEACHNDGIPFNNQLSNLRWDSHKNNKKDQIKHGTVPYGERNGMSKVSISIAKEIKSKYLEGNITQQKLADSYQTSRWNVRRILKNNKWFMN